MIRKFDKYFENVVERSDKDSSFPIKIPLEKAEPVSVSGPDRI